MHIPTKLTEKFYKLSSSINLIEQFNNAVKRNELSPGNERCFTFGEGYSFLEGITDFIQRIHKTTEMENGDLIIPGSFFLPRELFGALNDSKKALSHNDTKSFITSIKLNKEDADGDMKRTKIKLVLEITRVSSIAYNCQLAYELS